MKNKKIKNTKNKKVPLKTAKKFQELYAPGK